MAAHGDEFPKTPVSGDSLDRQASPWGLGETLGFGVVIAGVYIGVSTVVFFVFTVIEFAAGNDETTDLQDIAEDGMFFSTASLLASLTAGFLVVGVVAMRRGIRIADYLKLKRPSGRDLAVWSVLLVVIFLPVEWIRTGPLGQPDVPESMLKMYRSCEFLPILWLAVVIGAPFGEEFFFRGFLFEGIRHSRLGPVGAVLICAWAWAVIHLQYNPIDMSVIFLGGLFLGLARLRTNSLWVPVFLHFVWNLLSMIQMAWVA